MTDFMDTALNYQPPSTADTFSTALKYERTRTMKQSRALLVDMQVQTTEMYENVTELLSQIEASGGYASMSMQTQNFWGERCHELLKHIRGDDDANWIR